MKLSPKQLFWLSVALQAIFLVVMVAYKQYALMTGQEITLRTQPVDPRSLFQGDYVVLSYPINRLDLTQLEVIGKGQFKQGGPVYVVLEQAQNQPYFIPAKVSATKPDAKYYIKGKINYMDYYGGPVDCARGTDCILQRGSKPTEMSVYYGIESYFVPEGQGRGLEDLTRRRNASPLLVTVAVDGMGQGLIKKLVIDQTAIDAKNLNQVTETANELSAQNQKDEDNTMKEYDLQELLRKMGVALADYKRINTAYPSAVSGQPPYDLFSTIVDGSKTTVNDFPGQVSSKSFEVNWLDNTAYADSFCLASPSRISPGVWHILTPNGLTRLNRAPQSLGDCGIEIRQSVATVEGYIFVDQNHNNYFDQGDVPFTDAEIYLDKLFDEQNGWQKMLKPERNGHFKFTVYAEGTYGLGAHSTMSTPVNIAYSKINSIVIKQGDASTQNNILVSF